MKPAMYRFTQPMIFTVLSLLFASACASDDKAATGESCNASTDCADNRCITGGSFPGGTCTPACNDNADCPSGFSCISRSSGMCLRNCATTPECTSEKGDGWQCRDESLQDGGGNRMVCIGS